MKHIRKNYAKDALFRKIGLPFFLIGMLLFSTCQEDDPADKIGEIQSINNWILENMQTYYLWTDHIPKSTDKTLSPSDYFETLIYDRKNIDRFSWIQDDFIELMNSIAGINMEAGYDFQLYGLDNKNVNGYITYIKPDSPAEKNGLHRGDLFTAINGQQITYDNYQSLLTQLSNQHTLGLVATYGSLIITKTITLPVVNYAENPILLDTVYTVQNKKIAYLVYNLFADDNGDNSNHYINELNTTFGQFKSQGINELIVDLRYNSGGTLSTTEALAAMISNRSASDLFGTEEYNTYLATALGKTYGADYNKTYFPNNIEKRDAHENIIEQTPINKLQGLSKVYFIVSGRTASASEILINGLRPYMNVKLIGETTYGKNVGSITIYEEDTEKQKTNKWGMQPIIVRFTNAQGFSDFTNGFTPDVTASENPLQTRPLGDTDEYLLNIVLNEIQGNSLRSNNVNLKMNVIASSIDMYPLRRNTFIPAHKVHKALFPK